MQRKSKLTNGQPLQGADHEVTQLARLGGSRRLCLMGTRPLYPLTADIHRDDDLVSFGPTAVILRCGKERKGIIFRPRDNTTSETKTM